VLENQQYNKQNPLTISKSENTEGVANFQAKEQKTQILIALLNNQLIFIYRLSIQKV
jgi:hypothetical protein